MASFRYAAVAAALLAGTAAVNAQTTIITQEPAQPRAVITTQPTIQLSPVQRQTIYRTITRERVAAPAPRVEYRIGARVPAGVQLYSVRSPSKFRRSNATNTWS